MSTRTTRRATRDPRPIGDVPQGYDPRAYPAFAVTVDIVILTLRDGILQVLLVERGEEPFRGDWAIPGGFKRPGETLDQAAVRELTEETGVDAAALLRQFGAYGDPGRDPRMNVVTVGYLAVLRDVPPPMAGTDASAAALVPVAEVVDGHRVLAFDHADIVRDAIERVRLELDVSGLATAFVGDAFTLAELRTVYEAVWDIRLDAANFRRSVADDGWLVPTGQRTRPGPAGGRPAELYRAGVAWRTGGPIHRERRSQS
jgi:8-oxo-dGTP diphosphatase